MGIRTSSGPAASIDALARPLSGPGILAEYAPVLEIVGDARIVLLGEATHGTHEFYRARARISELLIREQGFSAIACEADWPDAFRVNRYVRFAGDRTAFDALAGFQRFPQWMWRNAEIVELLHFMRDHNARRLPQQQAGFYGLDVYSLHASMHEVIAHLERSDPEAARSVREYYACFDSFGSNVQRYGYLTSLGASADCERQALDVLLRLRASVAEQAAATGPSEAEERFSAEQNARVVIGAERYYREMFRGRDSSWNLRDTHMADTLDALLEHLDRARPGAKLIVWAHNSHVGDARATSMAARGELSLGQLMRERHDGRVRVIGFSTYDGSVAAASEWDGPVEYKRVRPARQGSVEWMLHRCRHPNFILDLRALPEAAGLHEQRLERAIGVIYRPETELVSHYFHCSLPEQFDAVIHFDRTRPVTPLESRARESFGEAPETYPSGI